MKFNKLRAIWLLVKAKGYIVVTDKAATADVPYVDPYALKDIMMISAQQAAIEAMKDKLDDLALEHAKRIEQLSTMEG